MGATTGAATCAAVRAAVGAGAEENCVGAVLMVLMSEDSRVVIQDEAANREHNLQQNKLPYQLAGPPKLRWERFR
jgi:hypothetical protein